MLNTPPLISVVMIAFNNEKHIAQAIQSVLNQICQHYDLIIIDDGSTDKTLEIARSFQSPKIQIHSYTNSGPSAGRNRGIKLAKGEFISFIDADDLWTVDKLKLQLEALNNDQNSAVAYSWVNCIDSKGGYLHRGSYMKFSGNPYKYLLIRNIMDCGSNPLIRKTAFLKVGFFDETLFMGEDWEMWVRLAQKYNFIVVQKPQILYRQEKDYAVNALKRENELLYCINKIFTNVPQSYQYLKKVSIAHSYVGLALKMLEISTPKNNLLRSTNYLYKSFKSSILIIFYELFWAALLKIIFISLLPVEAARALIRIFRPAQDKLRLRIP